MQTSLVWRGMLPAVVDRAETPDLGERRLIERARAGDRAAFDRLVERHLERVWRVAYRIVRHPQDAEDVVQEVFVAAYSSLGSFRGDASLSTWLHRIAVTRALNHVERAAVKIERSSHSLDPEAPVRAAERPRRAATPLEEVEAGQLAERLARCLDELPADWRAVLALRDGESLSYERIARATGVAVGTVRSRLHRAREALRRCLEGEPT